MIPLIDVGLVVKEHYRTLSEDANWLVIGLLFFIVPAVFVVVFLWAGFRLTATPVNALITAFSIFAGLLFNVVFILFHILGKIRADNVEERRQKKLLQHLYANTLYALLLSALVLAILVILILGQDIFKEPVTRATETLTFFLLIHFGVTFLMIFNRLYVLFQARVDTQLSA